MRVLRVPVSIPCSSAVDFDDDDVLKSHVATGRLQARQQGMLIKFVLRTQPCCLLP